MRGWLRAARWVTAAAVAAVAGRGCAAEQTAAAWWRQDEAVVLRTADRLAADMRAGTRPADFHTGDPRFDGEWALVSCQMTVLSLTALLERFPEREARWRPAVSTCAAWLASPEAREFGTAAWGADALTDPDPGHTHAYLGWTTVALAAAGRSGDAEAADAAATFARRLATAVDGRRLAELETYPGETYPPDLAVVIAALALQGDHDEVVASLIARFRVEAIDPETGLVRQRLGQGEPGPVRGSGTMLAAHFLGYADPALARELGDAARRHLSDRVGPFGGVREVPRGAPPAQDVDSGPVVFGLSVSASGFGLSAARRTGDERWHRELFRSAHTAGAWSRGWFYTGGCLGNALLLTMMTPPSTP